VLAETFVTMSSDACTACAEHCESCIAEGASRCDENKCKEGYGLLKPEFVCDGESFNCCIRGLTTGTNPGFAGGGRSTTMGVRKYAEKSLKKNLTWSESETRK